MRYTGIKMNKPMCKGNNDKSGIYIVVNKINGKSFVGSSISLSYTISIHSSLNSLRKVKGSISCVSSNNFSKYMYYNYKK